MSKINHLTEIRKHSTIMLSVKTNATKTEITGYDSVSRTYKMEVAAPPQDNKANIEIVKFFKKNNLDARIISGIAAKKKMLRLQEL